MLPLRSHGSLMRTRAGGATTREPFSQEKRCSKAALFATPSAFNFQFSILNFQRSILHDNFMKMKR